MIDNNDVIMNKDHQRAFDCIFGCSEGKAVKIVIGDDKR